MYGPKLRRHIEVIDRKYDLVGGTRRKYRLDISGQSAALKALANLARHGVGVLLQFDPNEPGLAYLDRFGHHRFGSLGKGGALSVVTYENLDHGLVMLDGRRQLLADAQSFIDGFP